jgi:hypothetical protein
MEDKKWCHVYCRIKAEYWEIDPKFDGVCHEDCTDNDCELEHSDYSD